MDYSSKSFPGESTCTCTLVLSSLYPGWIANGMSAGSNPVEGNGHFFPSYRQINLSSSSDTLRPTQRRSLQMLDVDVPQIAVGVFHA